MSALGSIIAADYSETQKDEGRLPQAAPGCQPTASAVPASQSGIPDAVAAEMLTVLDYYADQLCEGWCEQSPDCARFYDCGGCLARRTAWKARGGEA